MKRRSRIRAALIWLLALGFAVVLVVAGGLWAIDFFKQPAAKLLQGCSAQVADQKYQLAPDQAENAALISAIALRRGLPPRAATIAIAVAMQESKIRNISYGDRDSVGMFQQRPSQGWGTVEQIMDPVYSINAFYDGLVKIPNYQNLTVTEAGDAVQRSAYPLAYGQHEPMARAFASALTGYSTAALSCTLDVPPASGVPDDVIGKLQTSFGSIGAAYDGTAIRIQAQDNAAWAYAQWAVSNAQKLGIVQVSFAGERWQRANNDGGANRGWQPADGASSQEVVIVLQATQSTG
ncbi:MAG: hypothetical protein IIZ13_15860 [Renibacterium sp.]|nr:hypothetical protein [Renibacterium sp.]